MIEADADFLTLTPAGHRHLKETQATLYSQGLGIRLGVKKGGCSGMSYDWGTVDLAGNLEAPYLKWSQNGVDLYIPQADASFVKRCLIDCEAHTLQQKQLVIRNPNADHECGCGISFGVAPTEASNAKEQE